MTRYVFFAMAASFVIVAALPEAAEAQKKNVEISKKFDGSVGDEKAMKPDVITSARELEAIWKTWKIPGEMPKVDFKKDMVVAVYSVGSKLNMAGAKLDDKGNLEVLGFGTRDIRPGFRYVLGIVSRDGVKTVNGKALPVEIEL